MDYRAPSFVEIKMDAEIGAYQEESDPLRDAPAFLGGLKIEVS